MRTHSNYKILLTALLLFSFAVGCCDPGKNPTTGASRRPSNPAYGDPCNSAECQCRRLPQHRHYQHNLQQGDEPRDHQRFYVYFGRARRGGRSRDSHLRCGDQYCHLYTLGPLLRRAPLLPPPLIQGRLTPSAISGGRFRVDVHDLPCWHRYCHCCHHHHRPRRPHHWERPALSDLWPAPRLQTSIMRVPALVGI